MTEDLTTAVESGLLDKPTAEKLDRLAPGSHCTHKSWGFGRVAEWNLPADRIVIDFQSKKGHAMQLAYAAQTLTPLASDHILVRTATDREGVESQAHSDSTALVKSILASYGGKASTEQITNALVPGVFTSAAFKRWWDAARKKLKSDGQIGLPSKKTDPYVLLENATPGGDRLLSAFRNARHTRDQIAALDEITSSLEELSNRLDEVHVLISQINDVVQRTRRLQPSAAIEMLVARDEIIEKFPSLEAGPEAPTIAEFLKSEPHRLTVFISGVSGTKQKRVLESLEPAFEEGWIDKALHLLRDGGSRLISDIFRLFERKGRKDQLQSTLQRWISERSMSSEMLILLCKERDKRFPDLFNAELLAAVFSALETDLLAEKRTSRLKDLLIDDQELIGDLLVQASRDVVRDTMRKLLLTPAIEDLSKRSLMARIVKLYPETQNMITGASQEEERSAGLVVSWASLEKRKAELDHLVTREIPQNIRDINIAKEQGDLRENAGFKAAKEHQRVLQRRRVEMERDLAIAQGTSFENPSTTQVSIGTCVTVRYPDGQSETFNLLGAWDSAPELGIVSYKAAVGQALLGAALEADVEVPVESGTRTGRIESITAFTDLDLLATRVHSLPAASN